MMSQEFDCTVVIGRFQPFHNGHLHLIQEAMRRAPLTFVFLGSSHSRSSKNIWTANERLKMMRPCFSQQELSKLLFEEIYDDPSDQVWVSRIQSIVASALSHPKKIALVGFYKDSSSYYLSLFKDWTLVKTRSFCEGLSASDIRKAYFDGLDLNLQQLPAPVIQFLYDFRKKSPDYHQIKDMFHHHLLSTQTTDTSS